MNSWERKCNPRQSQLETIKICLRVYWNRKRRKLNVNYIRNITLQKIKEYKETRNFERTCGIKTQQMKKGV